MTEHRKAAPAFHQPIVYRLGEDISHEDYNDIVQGVADYFAKSRKTTEPVAVARQAIQECLDGITKSGTPWLAAARSTLAARIRSKCRFDIETMQPLTQAKPAVNKRKKEERARARARRDENKRQHIMAEAKQELEHQRDPTTAMLSDERERWASLRRSYLKQFPEELGTVAAQAELEALCDLHIVTDRYRALLLSNKHVDYKAQESVASQFHKIKTNLGIHPAQLAKRVKEKTDTTIGAAAAKLEGLGTDWRDIRARFWIEEMIQMFQMYHMPSADGLGYQLDEIGLFGLTKCRTCACAKCGMRNFVGISEPEILDYLVEKGHMESVDPESPDPMVPEAEEVWEDDA